MTGARRRGGGVHTISRLSTRLDEDARESGQALVEYALILMFIALVAVAALESIGVGVAAPLMDAADGLSGA
jgi:Flp pilus assembly pilin Flp